jgi:hypothetical protein
VLKLVGFLKKIRFEIRSTINMDNKGKAIKFGLTIVLVTIVIVLIITFTFNEVKVENRHQAIGAANAYQSIIFNLKTGQHVSGSLNYTGDDSGTWFAIYDPNGNHLVTADNIRGNHTGTFTFDASVDGKYYLGIGKDTTFIDYIDYEYTVSPAILGLDKTELILIVVVVGSVLAVVVAIKSLRKHKNR